jgi:hypothetical protein
VFARPGSLSDAKPDPVAEDHLPGSVAQEPTRDIAQMLEGPAHLGRSIAEDRAWAAYALGQSDHAGRVDLRNAVADELAREAEMSALADPIQVPLLRPAGRASPSRWRAWRRASKWRANRSLTSGCTTGATS